ncbi:hypothetical protein [Acidithiobacillus albertensis]|nr:hypothetical protein [Acidithiobacillus albertensis]
MAGREGGAGGAGRGRGLGVTGEERGEDFTRSTGDFPQRGPFRKEYRR